MQSSTLIYACDLVEEAVNTVATQLHANLCIWILCGEECQKPDTGVMLVPPLHLALCTQMSHVLLRGSNE